MRESNLPCRFNEFFAVFFEKLACERDASVICRPLPEYFTSKLVHLCDIKR
ncbi:hypothetical protein HMPREF0742_02655 [Rothia aeria F0184]|uniref:Uncharacterized protein n=1 Tax=Rothia aeria F0184 TaxID=888019 RepID=U7UZ15_9MICC|nr:hypothetical protein HMPREF0742_02655 [Rothia aeria F0184]